MIIQENSQIMVSPHPEWDDYEGGLSNDETQIVVSPVEARFSDRNTVVRSASEGDENAYSVGVDIGSPGHETQEDIVVFRDARPAWEFAHLLTHYFAQTTDPETAKSDLIHSERGTSADDQWTPNRAIEKLGAAEVLEKLLSPYSTPDAISNVLR